MVTLEDHQGLTMVDVLILHRWLMMSYDCVIGVVESDEYHYYEIVGVIVVVVALLVRLVYQLLIDILTFGCVCVCMFIIVYYCRDKKRE